MNTNKLVNLIAFLPAFYCNCLFSMRKMMQDLHISHHMYSVSCLTVYKMNVDLFEKIIIYNKCFKKHKSKRKKGV